MRNPKRKGQPNDTASNITNQEEGDINYIEISCTFRLLNIFTVAGLKYSCKIGLNNFMTLNKYKSSLESLKGVPFQLR